MYIFICQQIHAVGWDLSNTNVKATMKKSAFLLGSSQGLQARRLRMSEKGGLI